METSVETLLRHRAFAAGIARGLLRDEGLAEDVAQETMALVLQRPPHGVRNLRGWLRRVAANLAWKRARAEGRRRRREHAAARSGSAPPVDDAVARLETQRRLVEEVLALPEPYRSTVIERFLDERTPQQMARRAGVPVATVRTRVRRGLALLRERLEAAGGRTWAWALVPLAGTVRPAPAAAATSGVVTMASKLTFAIGGFLLGAGATALTTHALRSPAPPRSSPPGRVEAAAAVDPGTEVGATATAGTAVRTPDAYLRRINEARDATAAYWIGKEIAGLDPARGRDIVLAVYGAIENPEKRAEVLRAFGAGHPFVLDLHDLGATDGDPLVRGRTFLNLIPFAFTNFQEDPAAYSAWRAWAVGLPLEEVLLRSARTFGERLRSADRDTLAKELRLVGILTRNIHIGLESGVAIDRFLREAGLPDVLAPIVAAPEPPEEAEDYDRDRELRAMAWSWLSASKPDDEFLRRVVLPMLHDPARVPHAAYLLGQARRPWAVDALIAALREASPREGSHLAQALGEARDKRAIPWLIAAIAADGSRETVYGLGWFGLNKLTGVEFDESHDGDWWLAWWDRNAADLPAAAAVDPRGLITQFRK